MRRFRFRGPRLIMLGVAIVVAIVVAVVVGNSASSSAITGAVRTALNQNGLQGAYSNLKCPSVQGKTGNTFTCTLTATETRAPLLVGHRYQLSNRVTGTSGSTIDFTTTKITPIGS